MTNTFIVTFDSYASALDSLLSWLFLLRIYSSSLSCGEEKFNAYQHVESSARALVPHFPFAPLRPPAANSVTASRFGGDLKDDWAPSASYMESEM